MADKKKFNPSEVAEKLRTGARTYKAFEHGAELADQVVALEQEINIREKLLASGKKEVVDLGDKLTSLKKKVADAEQEAKDIVADARRQAEEILAEIKEDGKKILSTAATKRDKAEADVKELEGQLVNLSKDIQSKNAELAEIEGQLEKARALVKNIKGE